MPDALDVRAPAPERAVEPLPALARSASVVVIGAGMAGLCTALELKEAGCSVTVLEAQRRVGGRVRTRRDFPDGLYIEEGATRFPESHHLTMHYVARFGLPLIPFDRPGMGRMLRIVGHDVAEHPWAQDAWPAELPLHPHERELTLQGLSELYVTPLLEEIGDPLEPGWPSAELQARFDTVGYADLLRSRGASEGAIRALSLGFHVGEGPNSVSALWWLETMRLDAGGVERAERPDKRSAESSHRAFKVRGGNDRLAEAFAQRLTSDIRFGRIVRSIEQDDDRVTVHVETPAGVEVYEADYVVCTVPLPLLLDLHFIPELEAPHVEAIAAVPYASLSRVALQCRERFWLTHEDSGFADTDEEVAELWDLTVGKPGERGVIVAYAGGNEARRVTAMPETERIAYTISCLERLLPGLGEYVEGGVSTCWDAEPWARGGGAWFRPGQMGLRPLLTVPHGRTHFAGEATSRWPGWVQGSFESARRAVTEVITRANTSSP